MTYYFKVKTGYNKKDYVVADENELQKVIYSMYQDIPIQIGDSYIRGKNIISITPHYHAYTGWNESYEPIDSDDFDQIKRDCPEFSGILEEIKNHVVTLMREKRIAEIGKPIETKKLQDGSKGFLGSL